MKDKLLSFLVLPSIMFALFLAFSPVGVNAEEKEVVDDGHKVIVCHAKTPENAKNGYNFLNIDKNSVFNQGHDIHDMDIIPTFKYFVRENVFAHYDYKDRKNNGECPNNYEDYGNAEKCRKKVFKNQDVEYTFSAKNWSTGGQIVHGLNCVVPNQCAYKSAITGYSDWSDWIGDTETLDIYRVRTAYQYDVVYKDLFNEDIQCNSEERYNACDSTITSQPTSTSWEIDPNDSTKEIQTTTTLTLDSTDETVVCATDSKTISRVIETNDEEEEDDDPSVLPATDDNSKDETGVVLAATGPEDNAIVYVVELLLVAMLVTYSVFFTKTYLKNSK